tara:strand:+ start:4031 stop:4597 length:567 start_codon:yes stop_codon:yes gene_type:complete
MGIDPVTLGVASLAVSAVGTGAQMMGARDQASGLRAAGAGALATAEFNNKIRLRNERVAKQEADLRERVGDREALRFRKKFSKLQATTETAFRKNTGSASTGTPLLVLMDSANEAEEEVQLIDLAARTEAGRIREQGLNQRFAGQLALLEGRQQQLGFNIKARAVQQQAFADAFSSLGSLGFKASQIV